MKHIPVPEGIKVRWVKTIRESHHYKTTLPKGYITWVRHIDLNYSSSKGKGVLLPENNRYGGNFPIQDFIFLNTPTLPLYLL